MPPKLVSQTDHVKDILNKRGIDYPAQSVVDEIADRGVQTTRELVHQVKSVMRREQEAEEEMKRQMNEQAPLREYVTSALKKISKPSDAGQVAAQISRAGYKTNSNNFANVVRTCLNKMVENNQLVRQGFLFALPPQEPPVMPEPTPAPEQKKEETPEPTTTVGNPVNNSDDLGNLVKVQRFMREIGGRERLKTYLATLDQLETLEQLSVR